MGFPKEFSQKRARSIVYFEKLVKREIAETIHFMTKRNNLPIPTMFLTNAPIKSQRELFPDRNWVRIKEDLLLSGWDQVQTAQFIDTSRLN